MQNKQKYVFKTKINHVCKTKKKVCMQNKQKTQKMYEIKNKYQKKKMQMSLLCHHKWH
jgi:hypothetical protein